MIRYAITDRLHVAGDEDARMRALLRQAERLALDGVDFLQVREKDLPFETAAALALRLQEVVAGVGGRTRVLLNASWSLKSDTTWPAGVGVHLSSAAVQKATGAGAVCRTVRPNGMVSASCHSVEEARRACSVADILLFAPVFEKRVHGEHVCAGSGLLLLAEVCVAVAPMPVLAMGGVTLQLAAACMDAGAVGIAGIRMFDPGG